MKKLITLLVLALYINGKAQLCYSPAQLFGVSVVGNQASTIAADFNGDGKMDMAITYDNKMDVRLGNGTGNLGLPQTYTSSGGALIKGDFNSDGKIDLMTGSYLFFGAGTGTFVTPPTYIPNTAGVWVPGDFNGDGFTDFVSLYYANPINNNYVWQDSIGILLGTGTGSFTLANKFGYGWDLLDMSTGDYDNDGFDDLAFLNVKSSSMGVTIFKSLGNGTFGTGTDFNVPPVELLSMQSVDLNADTYLDIVTANGAENSIYVLMGTGAGNFASPVAYATDSFAEKLAVADLNNDGILDIAASTLGKNSISVLTGNGNGTFAPYLGFPINFVPSYISAADFNSDGKKDFLVQGGSSGSNHFGLVLNGPIAVNIAGAHNICNGTNEVLTASGAKTYTWTSSLGTSTVNPYSSLPVGPTTYSLSGNIGVCAATATFTMGLFPNTNITLSGSSHVCRSYAGNIVATGANTYTWSANTGASNNYNYSYVSVSPTVATSYSVMGTDVNGCIGSANLNVLIDTIVNVAITGNTTYCSGQTTTLTAAALGATTYEWDAYGNNYYTPTFTANINASCVCTVSATTGACTSTNTVALTINPTPYITINYNTQGLCSGLVDTLTASGASTYTWSSNAGGSNLANVIISPSATTQYSVSSTTSYSCSYTATTIIYVYQSPTVTIVGPTYVCIGSTITLSESGCPYCSYTWEPGNLHYSSISVSPTVTTTYSLTGYDANYGCSTTYTTNIPIVTTLPNVVASSHQRTINAGDTAVLSASGTLTYTWMPGNLISQTNTVAPVGNITFTVIGGDGTCTDTDTIQVNLNNAPLISTYAGSTSGFGGDGGPLSSALFYDPGAMVFDALGNTYIADESNQRVRKVNASGIISTFAGNGTAAYSGDGGPATAASLYNPAALAIDDLGNLLIVDATNNVVRKVDSAGIITTIIGNGYRAGTGSGGYSGDGGLAINAELNNPTGIALDKKGNIYVSEWNNSCIRKVDKTTGIITTVAGNGGLGSITYGVPATSTSLDGPNGLVFDAYGNIYFPSSSSHVICKIDTNGILTRFAGKGTSGLAGDWGSIDSASFYGPYGIVIDPFGYMYVWDIDVVRKITPWGTIMAVAGYGSGTDGAPAYLASLTGLENIMLGSNGNLFVGQNTGKIRQITNCPTPLNITISGTDTICTGGNTVLTANGANNYIWNWSFGLSYTNTISISPISDITYIVIGNSNMCNATKTVSISLDKCVWPGDVNEDLIVDNNDLLNIGVEYGKTGYARSSISNTWQGYTCTNWNDTLSN